MRTLLGKTLPVRLIPTLRPTLTLALLCYTEHQRYLWNYRSYTITLQHMRMRCTQTSGHFMITVNKNVRDKDWPGDRQRAVYKIKLMLWLAGHLHWWDLQKPQHTIDWTQMSDKKLWRKLHVVFGQRTSEKCTKKCDKLKELSFCSFWLFCIDVFTFAL